jgi:hypothetical protein
MSSADEIAAAFGKVDELLLAATAAAPAVALLAARAAERGISRSQAGGAPQITAPKRRTRRGQMHMRVHGC